MWLPAFGMDWANCGERIVTENHISIKYSAWDISVCTCSLKTVLHHRKLACFIMNTNIQYLIEHKSQYPRKTQFQHKNARHGHIMDPIFFITFSNRGIRHLYDILKYEDDSSKTVAGILLTDTNAVAAAAGYRKQATVTLMKAICLPTVSGSHNFMCWCNMGKLVFILKHANFL